MQIKVKGKDLVLRGYCNLDAVTDQAFYQLLTSFLNDPDLDYGNLANNYLPLFENAMFQFFDKNVADHSLQDGFFSNLTFVWKPYFESGRFGEAQSFWIWILLKTREWEQKNGLRVHKGSALYFWAVTAILQEQIDKGFFLMHRAFEEDVITSNTDYPPTPAFMFVTLNFQDNRQFFYSFVVSLAELLDKFLTPYRVERKCNFTLSDFRSNFLVQPPRIHTVFSFTHSLSKLWSLSLMPKDTLHSEFAGQYELNTLFDIVLVIDEAIRYKDTDPNHNKYLDYAEFLAIQSGLDISRADLIYSNSEMKKDFDSTMSDLVDGVFRFGDGKRRSMLSCALAISYCIRNHAAHNLSAFPSIWKRFEEIRQRIFNVLFLCVDTLY